jgi:RHS repeat-associated protein
VYDFENHLIQQGGISIVYDGDGNRVSKTVAGVTTLYLVDDQNPTGYAQVVAEEAASTSPLASYSYGLEQVVRYRQFRNSGGVLVSETVYYVHDGHGSVRALTDQTGTVTDTYDYDAFGNLIHQTGTTPNNYLFAGEQFDSDLNLYYNRARYLNTRTGRFWSIDSFDGDSESPMSLHKYLYALDSPVDMRDPSGQFVEVSLGATALAIGIASAIGALEVGALALYLRHEKAVVAGTAALQDAKILAGYALSNLMNRTALYLVADYFDTNPLVVNFVTNRYLEIYDEMSREIAFERGDALVPTGTAAYVYSNVNRAIFGATPPVIHITSLFFTLPELPAQGNVLPSRAGVILHEIAHIVIDAEDIKGNLTQLDLFQKLRNADNYRKFAEASFLTLSSH